MTLSVLAALAGLALVDSTSLGTLVVPLLMLVHPRIRPGLVLLYLATLAIFYFVLGVAILLAADRVSAAVVGLENSRLLDWTQLVVGAGLLIGSFWPDTPFAKRAAARRAASGEPSRGERWVERVVGDDGRTGAVVTVALVAGLVEAASMLPYLGALAIIGAGDLHLFGRLGVLAGYVVVMSLPALVLLAARWALGDRADAALGRVASWVGDRVGGAVWWVIGIVGFFVLADAVNRLGLFD